MKRIILATYLALLILTSACSKPMTLSQRGELFNYGTITEKDTTWNVSFIPGQQFVSAGATKSWKRSKELMSSTLSKQTLDRNKEMFREGIDLINSSTRDFFWEGLKKDSSVYGDELELVFQDGTFAAPAVFVYGTGKFLSKTVIRTLAFPFGVAAGALHSTVLPTMNVAYRPILGTLDATTLGTAVPAIGTTSNAILWAASQASGVPTFENFLINKVREN